MKTLKKLAINPEKVIKNEELANLKGGYWFMCVCSDGSGMWQDDYYDVQEMIDDIEQYCSPGGGSCNSI